MPNGIDQSWSFADPATAYRDGIRVAAMYLSWDASKNVTASKIKRYHKAGPDGIAWLPNWESQAGAPLNGAAQGRADAIEAVRQLRALIKAVGYAPRNRLVIYFSCDRDVTAGQLAGNVAAYYGAAREVCHAAGFGVGAYGSRAVVHFLASHSITDAEWQTYAWSGGALDPAADFYQYSNGQKVGGASVDFDRVVHAAQLGAWWAPSNPHNNDGSTQEDDPLADLTNAQLNQIADAVWSRRLKDDATHVNYQAQTYLMAVRQHELSLSDTVASLAQIATDMAKRVASLQAAMATVGADVKKAAGPAAEVKVDTDAVIAGVAAALKSIEWKASA